VWSEGEGSRTNSRLRWEVSSADRPQRSKKRDTRQLQTSEAASLLVLGGASSNGKSRSMGERRDRHAPFKKADQKGLQKVAAESGE